MNTQFIPRQQLVEHPKNGRYFSPLTGDDWRMFLDDVAERGIVEPLIVTPVQGTKDLYRVVSGHNRLSAAKELQIDALPCIVTEYASADDEIDDLIRCNVQRRQLDAFTKVKLAAEMLARQEDRRARNGDRGGENAKVDSVPMAQNRNVPPRDYVARELAMHTRDISAASIFAGLPDEAKARLAAWAEENNPSKKRLRDQIAQLQAEKKAVAGNYQKARREVRELAARVKHQDDLAAVEAKIEQWSRLNHDDAEVAEAIRMQHIIVGMRRWMKDNLTDITWFTPSIKTLTLLEPYTKDLLTMLDEIRKIVMERYVERLWVWRQAHASGEPQGEHGDGEE